MGCIINPSTNRPFLEPKRSGNLSVRHWMERQLARSRNDSSYAGAGMDPDLRRWWKSADGLSANAANSPAVRRTLRNRARYEFANNSYCMGLALTLANDLIGWGPTLRMTLPGKENEKINTLINVEFERWAQRVRLAAKLRTMKVAKVVDGETFAIQITNPQVAHPVKLDVRLVEAEQIATPDLYGWDETAVDGIRFDGLGNPTEYHLLKYHPGGPFSTSEYRRLRPADVIHWFRPDRPGQWRAVSELTPSLMLFALLRRWTLAVVQTAELQADFTLFLKSRAPANTDDYTGAEANSASEPFDLLEVERGMMTTLPDGTEPHQLEPNQPSSTYAEGKREILSEIARCQSVPYNVVACDSSDHSFASGKLDRITYNRSVDVERDDCDLVVMHRIIRWWLAEAVTVYPELMVASDLLDSGLLSYELDWPALVEADQVKEAVARETNLSCGMTSFQTEYARLGLDWQREQAKQAEALGMDLETFRRRLADKVLGPDIGATGSAGDGPADQARKTRAAAAMVDEPPVRRRRSPV